MQHVTETDITFYVIVAVSAPAYGFCWPCTGSALRNKMYKKHKYMRAWANE